MAVVAVTRSAFTQINAAAARIQPQGGRIELAESASPADKDWQVLKEGEFLEVTAVKYARALDTKETWVAVQPL